MVDTTTTLGNTVRNDNFSYLHSWFNSMTTLIGIRRDILTATLDSGGYDLLITKAGGNAGRRPSWHLEKPLLERVKKCGFGRYIKDFGVIKPEDFDSQLKKGEELMTKEAKFSGNRKRLMSATLRVKTACKFPTSKFVPATVAEAAEQQLNKTSSSGFPLFRRKGHVLEELIAQTESLLRGESQFIWDWPIVRGFRIQIRESLGALARKIRLMYPYPGCIILLEDTFIMPFVNHFINTDTFYVIGKSGYQIGRLLNKRFNKRKVKRITSLDVSAYDQNLVNEAIICAFWILRSQMKLQQLEDSAFKSMVSYFCTSLAVSKNTDGKAYGFIKHHGVPSGSGFTNMIDTIAHAIVLEYLSPMIIEKCLICGDDNIFDSTGIDLVALYLGYKTVFNLPISVDKTDNYEDWRTVSFLGFVYKEGVRYISYLLTINQLVWHQEFIVDLDPFEREVARGASILLNGINGRWVFEKLFPEVMDALTSGEDIRVRYLQGYMPPALQAEALNLGMGKTHMSISLVEHLKFGYLIR